MFSFFSSYLSICIYSLTFPLVPFHSCPLFLNLKAVHFPILGALPEKWLMLWHTNWLMHSLLLFQSCTHHTINNRLSSTCRLQSYLGWPLDSQAQTPLPLSLKPVLVLHKAPWTLSSGISLNHWPSDKPQHTLFTPRLLHYHLVYAWLRQELCGITAGLSRYPQGFRW